MENMRGFFCVMFYRLRNKFVPRSFPFVGRLIGSGNRQIQLRGQSFRAAEEKHGLVDVQAHKEHRQAINA